MSSGSSSSKSHSASKDLYDKAEKERRKLMDSINRGGLPPDLAAMQAFAQGKLPSSSSKSSKDSSIPLPMPPEFSQALFAEMAAQAAAVAAAAASSSSSNSSSAKRREQEMKEAFEQLSKSQVELFARNLGMGSGISLIPTSSSSSTSVSASNDEHKSRRSRQSDHISITTPTKDDHSAHMMSDDKPSPSRRSETTMEKVTLTPVAAASIASLPPQTTITIAPTTLPASTSHVPSSLLSTMSSSISVPENLSSSLKQKSPTPQSHRPMPPPSPQQQMSSPPTRASPLPPPQSIPQSHHEMDLEDLIAPSKVSKGSYGGTHAGDELENSSVSDQDHEMDKQNMDASSNSSNPDDSDKKASGGRRTTRGKRPRSGDDFDVIGIPERKRELRSSAGRLAAAAAARHAAEAKLAASSSQDTLNLSTSSNDDNDRSET